MILVSQDKKMIFNYENIEAIGIGDPLENNNGKFAILIETISDNQYPIAEYETEERAKEVLQEIANYFSINRLNGSYQQNDLQIKLTQIARYEMPKK